MLAKIRLKTREEVFVHFDRHRQCNKSIITVIISWQQSRPWSSSSSFKLLNIYSFICLSFFDTLSYTSSLYLISFNYRQKVAIHSPKRRLFIITYLISSHTQTREKKSVSNEIRKIGIVLKFVYFFKSSFNEKLS